MQCVSFLATLAIVLCSPTGSASDDGLTVQESRVSDIIHSVVDRYLGQGRDSSALSLALLDAIQTEGVRSLLDEDQEQRGDEPSTSAKPPVKRATHLDIEKREAPLPPPELLREIANVGEFGSPLNTMYMEVAGQHRNCTKRKRRRKKPRIGARIGSETRDPAPSFVVPGMTPQTQRTLTEYSHTGVPPVGNVEISRLTTEEQNYFEETTTRSSIYNSDGGLLTYSVTQRPVISRRDDSRSTVSPNDSGSKSKSSQQVRSSPPLSSHRIDHLSEPLTFLSIGSSTLFPPPATTRSNRRNPFEKFERSTPLPSRHDAVDALVPKRASTAERSQISGFTEAPRWSNADNVNRRIYNDDATHDLNSFSKVTGFSGGQSETRLPQIRPGPTTVPPKIYTDGSTVHVEPASLTVSPHTATTASLRNAAPEFTTTTAAPNFSFRTAEPSQLRTLVPSSLNKGTLQHFSLYPKYPQVNSQSKIILAVGGARYAPLPVEVVMALGNKPGEAAKRQTTKSDYNDVVPFTRPSVPQFDDDQQTIGQPLVELITKNGKVTRDHSNPDQVGIKSKNDTAKPILNPPARPSGVLSMSPKVVSGQVLVFSSQNMPDDSDHTDVTTVLPATTEPHAHSSRGLKPAPAVDTGRTVMLKPIDSTPDHSHDPQCDHAHEVHDCVEDHPFESRSQTKENSGNSGAAVQAKPVDGEDEDDIVPTTSAPHFVEDQTTPEPRATASNSTSENKTMPQAPTIIMQVPAPEMEPDAAAHGYARGSARLHVPFVYHVQKSLQNDKGARTYDGKYDETKSLDGKPLKHGSSRTLISLPNNPFARLAPLKADYYKYGKSPVKGYLPKSFLRLERLRNVKLEEGQHRSMLLFE